MIFRNDDVNPNSNFEQMEEIYSMIREAFPGAEIYSCVTILAKKSENGSAYPEIKKKEINFPVVDRMVRIDSIRTAPWLGTIVSHGLFHLSHRDVSEDLQRYSILASCELLRANIFIPPFWEWNRTTEKICRENGILLWTDEDWVNIERLPVDEKHDHYLFHSWKFTPETFRVRLEELKKTL